MRDRHSAPGVIREATNECRHGVLRRHADELLTRDELQRLLDGVAQQHPKTVKDLVPETLPMTTVLSVCRNLLRERIPVKDLATIADALSEAGTSIKDPVALTEHVRHRLSRTISTRLTERDGTLPVAVVDHHRNQHGDHRYGYSADVVCRRRRDGMESHHGHRDTGDAAASTGGSDYATPVRQGAGGNREVVWRE